ncbi:YihY/virulence factor BrkB family protein [Oceaniglobus indicus]|uniref:YihY/virulence factor BrkB family protein n=1 Tax=Oceaniglobus indicus TaxID=2047749 RepID=UPI000C1940C3|nr:YihY/virulence factor BrkB family protein [Oceaniglobus indicus]
MTRGRDAETPNEIPKPGWKDILLRVKDEIAKDHVGLIAAGVAFYGLLALFPAITALMALAGLVLEPSEVTAQIESLATVIPDQAADIIIGQAVEVAGSQNGGLGLALLLGLGLALYSASKGVGSLMEGLNVAYDEDESRGFIKLTLVKLGLTLLLIVGLVAGLGATLALPAVLSFLNLPDWLNTVLGLARWVILGVLTLGGLGALYRWGPSREDAQWKWLAPGTLAACALWLIGSLAFSVYVANFASYNESFGSMAGVIILLMWLWLSAYVVLMGAELNAEIEAQTARDTTTGTREPMGARGAEKADRLGETSA